LKEYGIGELKMKLKSKPKKPVRKGVSSSKCIMYDIHGDLIDTVKFLADLIDEDAISQKVEVSHYYDDVSIELTTVKPESDEVFNKRMDNYKARKKVYDAWYAENKDEIEAEIKMREDKKEYTKQKEIRKLQEKLDKLKANG
jgi:predicted transposase YbfD/YdcC